MFREPRAIYIYAQRRSTRYTIDWQGRLPNLLNIFPTKEIDWLLTEAAKIMKYDEAKSFIEFVARSGYKVKPKVSKNGKQSSRRTTPLHHLCRRDSWPFSTNLPVVANWLFDIYDGIDVNYTDKSKLTHFHVACKFGRTGVVKKFLELGQDPNLIWPEEKRSPLHLAMKHRQREVSELLLRAGADPNSVDNDGMTPLIAICEYHGDVDLARMLFEFSDKKYRVRSIISTSTKIHRCTWR
ncbi:unnamed protein product [Trichogramma brassicae]|uniref:Uncharacterized protein n=1 Tax=Trichogramma brassicae TaxID=86971 RepID=A0A6H5J8P1_9HYME|nr:unnamed protein product [Trichogramma brassicae]